MCFLPFFESFKFKLSLNWIIYKVPFIGVFFSLRITAGTALEVARPVDQVLIHYKPSDFLAVLYALLTEELKGEGGS